MWGKNGNHTCKGPGAGVGLEHSRVLEQSEQGESGGKRGEQDRQRQVTWHLVDQCGAFGFHSE